MGDRPLSRNRVPETDAICEPLRSTWYAVTPMSSDEAAQESTIALVDRPVTWTRVGAVGFLVSGTFRVTPDAAADGCDALPEPSSDTTV